MGTDGSNMSAHQMDLPLIHLTPPQGPMEQLLQPQVGLGGKSKIMQNMEPCGKYL